MKYVNHLSAKQDYVLFYNRIEPYAAVQYGLHIFQLTIQYYVSLYIQIWYKKGKFIEKLTIIKNVD